MKPIDAFNELYQLATYEIPYVAQWGDGMGHYANATGGYFAPKVAAGSMARSIEPILKRRLVFLAMTHKDNVVLFERNAHGYQGTIAANTPSTHNGYKRFFEAFRNVHGYSLDHKLSNLSTDTLHDLVQFVAKHHH